MGKPGSNEGTELFWRLVLPRLDAASLQRGTIMGRPCVRSHGDFVAMPHSKSGALIVKLDAYRVADLVQEGVGEPFAPAGRVFKEWLAVPNVDEHTWDRLIQEAMGEVSP